MAYTGPSKGSNPKRKHAKTGKPRGRPRGPGSKVGRPKGSANKIASEARKRLYKELEETGDLTPLEFCAREYRNVELPRDYRLEAAKAALPYMHSKMPNITQVQGDPTLPLVQKIEHTIVGVPDWDNAPDDEDNNEAPTS